MAIVLVFLLLKKTILGEKPEAFPTTMTEVIQPVSQEKSVSTEFAGEKNQATETSDSVPAKATELKKKIILTRAQIESTRAQAKSTLSITYIGETEFFNKHKRYTTDLKAIGYTPVPGTTFKGKFGFLDAFKSSQLVENESADRKNSDAFIKDDIKYGATSEGIVLEKVRAYCSMGCGATADKFEVISATNLDDDDDLDLWTINEQKEIIHVFDDLAP